MIKEFSVYITPVALEDMERIYNYFAQEIKSIELAKEQFDNIAKAILSLSTLPERCPVFTSEPEQSMEIRRLICDNYLICYIIRNSKVYVTDVIYGASNVHSLLEERHK